MKIKQVTKNHKKNSQNQVYPSENIFEPRNDYEYLPWLNSTLISSKVVTNKQTSNINLHGIMKPTKMKKRINLNNAKDMKPAMKNLTMKSLKASFGNFFRPSKRIGRYQDDLVTEKKQALATPVFKINNCKLTSFQPATLIKPNISYTPKKSTRTQVRTTLSTNNKSETDSKSFVKMRMKPQPTMGIDMKIRKANINSAKEVQVHQVISKIVSQSDDIIKKIENKKDNGLMPFLDGIESFGTNLSELEPACSSTFFSRTYTKSSNTECIVSPVSIRSKAKKYATVVPRESNNIFNRI